MIGSQWTNPAIKETIFNLWAFDWVLVTRPLSKLYFLFKCLIFPPAYVYGKEKAREIHVCFLVGEKRMSKERIYKDESFDQLYFIMNWVKC